MDYVKQNFSLPSRYNRASDIKKFIDRYEATNQGFFRKLNEKEYQGHEKPVIKLVYDVFKDCSTNSQNL